MDSARPHVHRRYASPLLTTREAAEWLRLTESDGPKHPEATIKRFRDLGLLRGVKVGRQMRYHVSELDRLIERLLERGEV